jgi:pyruvate/2-oxoglutarate dehydrogenase complex dihydrolipoamide acyltransferase (E2) component
VPAVVNGAIVARPVVTLRFSFDERVEDGLYAARSLKLFAERVEDPAAWIP